VILIRLVRIYADETLPEVELELLHVLENLLSSSRMRYDCCMEPPSSDDTWIDVGGRPAVPLFDDLRDDDWMDRCASFDASTSTVRSRSHRRARTRLCNGARTPRPCTHCRVLARAACSVTQRTCDAAEWHFFPADQLTGRRCVAQGTANRAGGRRRSRRVAVRATRPVLPRARIHRGNDV